MPEQEDDNIEIEEVSLAQLVFDEKPNEFKNAVEDYLYSSIQDKINDFIPDVADNMFNGTAYNEVRTKKTWKNVDGKAVKTAKIVDGHKDKIGRKGSKESLKKSGMKKTNVKGSIKAKATARRNPGAIRKRERSNNKASAKRIAAKNKRMSK